MGRKNHIDSLDARLIRLLAEEGRTSVGDLAAELDVSAPTVRSRMKSLEASGMLKVGSQIDASRYPELIVALIGLNVQSCGHLDDILEKLAALEPVTWAAVVTGRYDVMVEAVVRGGMADLYHITTDLIPTVGNVVKSETFVIMKSVDKWMGPPRAVEEA